MTDKNSGEMERILKRIKIEVIKGMADALGLDGLEKLVVMGAYQGKINYITLGSKQEVEYLVDDCLDDLRKNPKKTFDLDLIRVVDDE